MLSPLAGVLLGLLAGCAALPARPPAALVPEMSKSDESLWAFFAGHMADENNDYAKAVNYYRYGIEYNPEASDLRRGLVSDLIQLKRFPEAQAEYRVLLERNPKGWETRFMLAQLFDAAGDTAAAEVLYRDVIHMGKESSGPFTKLGVLLLRQDKATEGVARLQEALRIDPGDREARMALVKFYLTRNQNDLAVAELGKALEQSPQDEEWLAALGQIYNLSKQKGKSAEVYRRLLEADPHSQEALYYLSLYYLEEAQWEQATQMLEKMLRLNPDDLLAHRNLGLAFYKLGRYDDAREQLEPLLAGKQADAFTHQLMGSIYTVKNLPYLAADEFRAAIHLDQSLADAYLGLGNALASIHDLPQALSTLREAGARFEHNLDVQIQLGLLLLRAQAPEEAVTVFKQALSINPRQAGVYFNLGQAYLQLKQHDQAVAAWKQAIRLDPRMAEAYNYLGYIYADRGLDLDQAVRWLEKALALSPRNGFYLDSLGWAYFKQGKFQLALKKILAARSLMTQSNTPVDPVVDEHLGDIYSRLGDYPAAEQAWRQALQSDPDNPTVKNKLQQLLQPREEKKP